MNRLDPTKVAWTWGQGLILLALSIGLLATAPTLWRYNPDSGVYIGSALSLVQDGRYWFNGHPNLLYYPGFSGLLALPIVAFGLDFHALHVFTTLLGVVTLWLLRGYFSAARYGWIGLLLPLLVACNLLVVTQLIRILSDLPFLGVSIAALWLWRRYRQYDDLRHLLACALLIALASMLRFQGLFLVAAFGLALLTLMWRRHDRCSREWLNLIAAGTLAVLPFALWTFRNFLLYTPDTYNMAGSFFFGQHGLPISEADWGTVAWIDAEWKYLAYQAIILFGSLGKSFFGGLEFDIQQHVMALVVVLLIAAGLVPWLRSTNLMEGAYVLISGAFLLYQALGGTSLYFPTRYWIPLLPFFILFAGLGIRQLAIALRWWPGSKVWASGMVLLVGLIVASGTFAWANASSSHSTRAQAARLESIADVSAFVRENTPHDALLLTTDWGVGPLMTQRASIQVPRSLCTKASLELMAQQQPQYLVVMPGLLRTPLAKQLVDEHPNIFRQLFATDPYNAKSFAAVFEINSAGVAEALKTKRCD